MSTVDSFGAKSTLTVGSTDYEIFRIDAVAGYEKLPFSLKVLLENLLRTEDGANVTKAQIEALGSWDAAAEPDTEIQFTPARVVMQDFTGVPVHRRPRHHARGRRSARRRPEEDQPALAGRDGHRPLRHRRPVRHRERAGAQRRDRVRAQRRAVPVPALGPDRVRRLQGRPAGHRHRAPGEHRAPREGHLRPPRRRRSAGVPRHVRRHRLAHHDGQRPRRARLGCRRHRGRGRDARPAGVDAHPEGRRIQALRRDPDRRHRDRRRAHDHRDAAQARRRRQVRRVLRLGRGIRAPGQPRHDRQHEPGVRLHRRDVPDRRGHARLPPPHRPQRRAGRARRGVLEAADALARRRRRSRSTASTSNWTSPPSSPRSPGRSDRRTASSSRTPRPSSRAT